VKTIKQTATFSAPSEKIFNCLDDLVVTGMHITSSSAMMMCNELRLQSALAYFRYLDITVDQKLKYVNNSIQKNIHPELATMLNDYARTGDVEAQRKFQLMITGVYKPLPFPVVSVPILAPEEPVRFILKNL
jgi:hypothetical protein